MTPTNDWPALSSLKEHPSEPLSQPDPMPALRLFATWEICRYMIPVAPAHLRRVLRDTPDLPQGIREGDSAARWFSLRDIMQLRQFFAQTGRGARAYLPYRPQGLPAQTIAVIGNGAGTGKTALCLHLATRAALEGYRVLVIDLDPSGALTVQLPAPDLTPALPGLSELLARHYGEHLQAENRARLARGADPLAVNEALAAPLARSVQDLVRPSLWHRLDVLPSDASLWESTLQMAEWSQSAPGWRSWDALHDRLRDDGLLARYDLIVMDAPPLLDALALSALHLANLVVTCAPATPQGAAQALHCLSLLARRFGTLETRLNTVARTLGGAPVSLGQARCQILLNGDVPTQSGTTHPLRSQLGALAGLTPLPHQPLMTTPGGFFALDPRQIPREAYVGARSPLETLWSEMSAQIRAGWAASSEAAE